MKSLNYFIFLFLVLPVHGSTRTWDGGDATNNWSAGLNWTTNVAPVALDDLIFPISVVDRNTINDFASGTDFSGLQFNSFSYVVDGNLIDLVSGGITLNYTTAAPTEINASLRLQGAGMSFNSGTGAAQLVTGSLNLNGHNLTLTGSGSVEIGGIIFSSAGTPLLTKSGTGSAILSSDSSFVGDVSVSSGTLYANAFLGGTGTVSVGTSGTLAGNNTGVTKSTTVTGTLSPGTLSDSTSSMTFDALSFPAGAGTKTLRLDIQGVTAGSTYDRVVISNAGSLALNSASLVLEFGSFIPTVGTVFTLIDNQSTANISGTFSGVFQGTQALKDGQLLQFSYLSGTGNDFTATVINQAPVAADQAVSTDEDTPKSITLTATDPNGQSLTYTIIGNPANGTLSGSGASRTYTPNPNYNGPDIFTFRASDGALNSATKTVSITVNAVDDPLTTNNLFASDVYTPDTPLNLTDIVVSEDDPVTVTLTLVNLAAGSLSTGTSGAVSSTYNPATGVWTASGDIADINNLLAGLSFTPALGFNGAFSIVIGVSNGVTTLSGVKSMTSTNGPALHEFVDPNPNPGNLFGISVAALSTGNVVITAPFDDAGGTDAGAVYLFNGATGALISTLRGSSANDQVGSQGVTSLSTGNYVVRSPDWDNGPATNAGAVTFGKGTTGVDGTVNSANSLVGSSIDDQVGVRMTTLSNGNYVVSSSFWDNGAATNAGAVTFGNGTTGVSGAVSAANSLVGTTAEDRVGSTLVRDSGNGNYVVQSPDWNNGAAIDAGAVTFGNGTTGISGAVSAANSLVGSTTNDRVGGFNQLYVIFLENGNYVVLSPDWDNGAVTNAGAATFGDGATGVSGTISASNSLVGSTMDDQVGLNSMTVLSNGNYVVASSLWDNGAATNAGAVTFGSGTTGISGAVSAANSLVGSTTDDQVGSSGVTALSNGNYVVRSPNWNNGAASEAGAVTFGNGTTGISGPVSAANSLVGSSGSDRVGNSGITALSNGNYVVRSSNGVGLDVGAVTFGNGTTGISGAVSAANSLVGSTIYDRVGTSGITALSNGNYVVSSQYWNNGGALDAGAVTFGNGSTGISGAVSSANSLVGSQLDDRVGKFGVTALFNGNYVVRSPDWNNGPALAAGAVTFGSGTTGISGAVSAANSLVGSRTGDVVGEGAYPLENGNYVVLSQAWDNGAAANAGAATFGNGTTGISGAVSAANSLVGSTTGDLGNALIIELGTGNYLVRLGSWDNESAIDAGALTFGNGSTGVSGAISAANSLVGSKINDRVGFTGVTVLSNGNYVVRSSDWDNQSVKNAGAVTFGDGTTGVSGIVTSGNSARGAAAPPGSSSSTGAVIVDNVNATFFARFPYDGSGKVRVGKIVTGFAPVAQEITIFSGGNTAPENDLTDTVETVDFGIQAEGTNGTELTYTIRNSGVAPLTNLAVSASQPNAGHYAINTAGMGTTLAPGATTTFSVSFSPTVAATGTRPVTLLITSNDVDENPFEVQLTGTGLSLNTDTDSDGLNDASEFQMAALGFDWQTSQPALVNTLNTGIGGARTNLNAAGYFSSDQVQALHVGTPLIQRNPSTGLFKLTMELEKSTNLTDFQPFPFLAPQTGVNNGKIEFDFASPENAAFFRIEAR